MQERVAEQRRAAAQAEEVPGAVALLEAAGADLLVAQEAAVARLTAVCSLRTVKLMKRASSVQKGARNALPAPATW